MRLVQNLICGIIHATIVLVINSAQPQLKQRIPSNTRGFCLVARQDFVYHVHLHLVCYNSIVKLIALNHS